MNFTYTLKNGTEVEVIIDRDYGYEADTNAHVVDWHIVPGLALTEEEDDEITQAIYNYLERSYDDYD